jgi:hypothetical protein
MQDEEQKELDRNDPVATAFLLYDVLTNVRDLQVNISEGGVSWFSALCMSKDMWDAVNYARLWSEKNHPLADALLNDALSHLAEVHYMIESMWVWDNFSKTAMRSVTQENTYATSFITKALIEVEHYINTIGEPNGDDEGKE